MRYRIRDANDRVSHEQSVDYRWHVVPASAVLAELSDVGLTAEVGDLDVVRAVRAT
jgi:hypothetical protein